MRSVLRFIAYGYPSFKERIAYAAIGSDLQRWAPAPSHDPTVIGR
jgi:hypothetical protein